MKPNRPDSAKSAKTRITIDSEMSSNNLTNSKFSQTFSNGVKANNEKNNDFHKYVAEKNKDPKFKKFLETNLPQIPQQAKPSTQLSKLTSKPFERKQSKAQKQKSQKKVQEAPKKIEQETKIVKKESLQNSKTFIDKSKQKLKAQSKQQIQQKQMLEKIQQSSEKQFDEKQNSTNKPKINLNGFVLNIPGKAPKIIKEEKAEYKKEESKQQKQRKEREKMMTELSQYVQQMQEKNIQYLPKRYDEFIERNLGDKNLDLQKIAIEDFLEQPNQRDYDNLMKKINENEYKLQQNGGKNGKALNKSGLSINLQEIIDGQDKQQQAYQDALQRSSMMSSMTASDMKDRNLFITDILKGRRLTEDQLSQIQQNDSTMIKMIKLDGGNRQEDEDEQDIEILEINMSKKKSNKFVQRNKYEAGGELYRECDFLTPEERQRIQDLINGGPIQSPFVLSQMQNLMNRRIDEGIKLHRQLCRDIEGKENQQQQQLMIDQSTLPKDPLLRKNAEMKILRDKISSINSRLATVNEVVINKTKIQSLISKYKEVTKPSKMSQSIIQEKKNEIQQQCQQLSLAESMLLKIQSQKDDILKLVAELSEQYKNIESDIAKIQKMDAQQLKQMEQQQLNKKKRRIQEVQSQAKQFQSDIDNILKAGEDLKNKIRILDQIMSVNTDQLKCEGYNENQTIEDLDKLITKKWKAVEQSIKEIGQRSI